MQALAAVRRIGAVLAAALGVLASDPAAAQVPVRLNETAGGVVLPADAAAAPLISPDGRFAAFRQRDGIWLKDLQTGALRRIVEIAPGPIADFATPSRSAPMAAAC